MRTVPMSSSSSSSLPAQRFSRSSERRLRVELLRMQADYERLAFQQDIRRFSGRLSPRAAVASLGARLGASGLGWAGFALRVLQRYPLSTSLLGSLVARPRRRRMLVKTALVLALAWAGRRVRRSSQTESH